MKCLSVGDGMRREWVVRLFVVGALSLLLGCVEEGDAGGLGDEEAGSPPNPVAEEEDTEEEDTEEEDTEEERTEEEDTEEEGTEEEETEEEGTEEEETEGESSELAQKLAAINAGFTNVEVELLEWPGELHGNLGAMSEFAYLTRPVETTSQKLPLIIALHGGGRTWWEKSLEERLEISAEIDKKQGFDLAELAGKELLMLEPNTTAEWRADELDLMLDYVLENFPEVDQSHVVVTGYSMGGKGAWVWLNESADRFAAAAIGGAGGGTAIDDVTKLANLPLWLIVGSEDEGPDSGIRRMVDQLLMAGNEHVEHRVVEGAGHREAGDVYFSSVDMVEWMLEFGLGDGLSD